MLPYDVIFRLLLRELRAVCPDLGCHADRENVAFEAVLHALHDLDAVRVKIAPGGDMPRVDVPQERDESLADVAFEPHTEPCLS